MSKVICQTDPTAPPLTSPAVTLSLLISRMPLAQTRTTLHFQVDPSAFGTVIVPLRVDLPRL